MKKVIILIIFISYLFISGILIGKTIFKVNNNNNQVKVGNINEINNSINSNEILEQESIKLSTEKETNLSNENVLTKSNTISEKQSTYKKDNNSINNQKKKVEKKTTNKTKNKTESKTNSKAESKTKSKTESKTKNKKKKTTKTKSKYWCYEGGKHHTLGNGKNDHGYYASYSIAWEKLKKYMKNLDSGNYEIDQCDCGLYFFTVTQN